MTLGQRIKEARCRIGITQAELSGDRISRNMLSMIENDHADPSYKTIQYLADRLKVPVCFFFEEQTDLAQARRSALMPQIYEKLRNREYHACLTLCAELTGMENEELYLIKAECYFVIGLQACQVLSFGQACDAFLSAISNANHTPYPTDYLKTVSRSVITWMSEFCKDGNPYPKVPVPPITEITNQYYLWLLPLIGTVPDALVEEMLMENVPSDTVAKLHIRARIEMRNGQYPNASALLNRALSETEIPLLNMLLLSDLETVYTQIKDYENAYDTSQKYRGLLRKLRTEDRMIDSLLSQEKKSR